MMSGDHPLVSVIITTYYRNTELQRAIDHVMDQNYDPIEVIVVDDSGEKHAKPIIEKFDNVEYIPTENNQGHIAACITGFEISSGQYIQFHDDDDWLCRTKIEKQMNLFREKDDIGVVYCGVQHNDGRVKLPEKNKRGEVLSDALRLNLYPCQTTTMLLDRTYLESVLPFPNYGGAFDWILMLKLSQLTSFEYVQEPLVNRITTEDSIGSSVQVRKAHLKIVDDHSELYNKRPQLKKEFISERYYYLGKSYLNENFWSFNAIISFLKSLYYYPKFNWLYFAYFIFSLGGRPGRDYGEKVGKKAKSFFKD